MKYGWTAWTCDAGSRAASIALTLRRFLTDGYDLKTVADYGIGPGAAVSVEDATDAIETAALFVDCIDTLLAAP
jgi:hypothetical protein